MKKQLGLAALVLAALAAGAVAGGVRRAAAAKEPEASFTVVSHEVARAGGLRMEFWRVHDQATGKCYLVMINGGLVEAPCVKPDGD